ncbi:MAG: protein kinase [Anaerolineales bacterium]
MEKDTIEIEDYSLDAAEEKLRSQIPEGYLLISKIFISDGKPISIRCVGDTAYDAFTEAALKVPEEGRILNKIELAQAGQEVVTVKAFNEEDALSIAEKEASNPLGINIKSIKILKLAIRGRKRFLFIKGTPNQYNIEIKRQAVVDIIYKVKVKLIAKIGLDKGSLFEAIMGENQEVYKRRLFAYLTSLGKTTNEIDIITSNQLNNDLVRLLKTITKRCKSYKTFVQDFINSSYFSLGPRISVLLSTYFITEAIEKHHIRHESDLRHLLYLLQPQNPNYSREALEFDKELDLQTEYNEAIDRLKASRKIIEKINSKPRPSKPKQSRGFELSKWENNIFFVPPDELEGQEIFDISKQFQFFNSQEWGFDEDLYNLYDAEEFEVLETLKRVDWLKNRLDTLSLNIELEKRRISDWIKYSISAPSLDDQKEMNAQKIVLNKKVDFTQLNFFYFEMLIGLLREKNLLYEASSFCDTLNEIIRNDLLPQKARATMTRARADFLKLAYKKTIQPLGDDKNQIYKVQGPVLLVLKNDIQECAVDFFIVGPIVEQITLPKASEGDNQTYFDIKPGRYVIVCEPKMSIPPLILEGDCLPGRQYPIGVQLVKQKGLTVPPIHKMGSGISIATGLFGAIEIDPLHSLELLFNGRKYQIQNYLGEGSGGIVYQAIDKENGSVTAFKFMTTDLLGSNSQIDVGKEEWKTYNSLESKECVIGILDFSEDLIFIQRESEKKKKKSIVAYQMEYANQGNLESYLEHKQDDISPNEIITILKQIGMGLESIHKAGLIHRDVRPQNILVFQDNPKYRVCDFTLTKSKKELILEQLNGIFNETSTKFSDDFTERRATSTLLSLHRVIGSSTFYAAPEDHDGSGVADGRSDIYSVGGILYWLLTGFEPFELTLRDRFRDLYEKYKFATEQHILRLDFQHRKELFGNFRQLDSELRNKSLHLKKQGSLNIDLVEVQYSGISETLFLYFKDFIAKTIQPNPNNRFQTILEMQAAINEMEKVV